MGQRRFEVPQPVAHLLRRVDELLEDAKRGQAKDPHAVRRLLQQALAARDAGELTLNASWEFMPHG
jgi:hypothetical protein